MKFKILLFFLILCSCQKEKKGNETLLSHFPPNAFAFIKINNPDHFKSELKNSVFTEKLKSTDLFESARNKIESVDQIRLNEDAVLAFYEIGKNNHEYLLLQKQDSNFLELSPSTNRKLETLTYENREIKKYSLENNTFYCSTTNGNILFSSSQLLLENAIRTNGKNEISYELEKLFSTADGTKSATFFFDLDSNGLFSSHLNNEKEINLASFADWISMDFSASQDNLMMTGVAVASDSTRSFVNLFKNTTPLGDKTASIAPQNVDAVLTFAFDEFDTFLNNQKHYLDAAFMNSAVFSAIEEVGLLFVSGKKAVVLHSIDPEGIKQGIDSLKIRSTSYQGSEIWQLDSNTVVSETFRPLVQDFESNYYVIFENAYVFAEEPNTLQTIIANKKSGYTFDQGPVYTSIKSQIANEASMLFLSGEKGLDHFAKQYFDDQLAEQLEKLPFKNLGIGAQLITDGDFSHFNFLLTQGTREAVKNSVSPIFTLELESDLTKNPQFVKNHRNNKHEIVVQDVDNNLYLISTEGKVLWKKQLEGRIQGKINQVDLYKNGKLQLAFCTNNQFLILDRNGDEVPPFTKKFEGGNLNPLAVFDYEQNRNYRFVVTQGRKIFMYNGRGDIVSGFTYTEAESPIISEPKHFRMGKKDYLVFKLENGQLKIRHRAGGERIKVKRTIDFSENEVYLYKNRFTVTDKKGVLHQVDTKGKLSATNFNLGENHGMFTTSKTLALMDENILNIKGKKVELELGVYSGPEIFYINDKIYVAVTDIQNQNIYLFDSQAKAISGFPVYGSSVVDLIDMDTNGKLELVAKDQDNSIIVYGIN